MTPSRIGLLVGLVLGLAAAFGGVTALLVVAVFGAFGFVVDKVIDGSIDVSSYVGRDRTRR